MANPLLELWQEAMRPEWERKERWAAARDAGVIVQEIVQDTTQNLEATLSPFRARQKLVKSHSWAVPTEEAIDAIVRHSPAGVVEIGAGSGYWAALIRARGVGVAAYDTHPYENYQVSGEWTHVERGGPLAVVKHPEKSLFLCWPPYDEPMAHTALTRYKGNVVLYVGEGMYGCTGDHAFHKELGLHWKEVEYVSLPQWPGIHDALFIYHRLGS